MTSLDANYDRFPVVEISSNDCDCLLGWEEIGQKLRELPGLTVIELYPGCFAEEIASHSICALKPDLVLRSDEALLSPSDWTDKIRCLTR